MEDADDFKKANKAVALLKHMAMKHNICIGALTHINKTSNLDVQGKNFGDKLNAVMNRRPTYKSMLGNVDKFVDDMVLVHQTYPALAALEPEENTSDYDMWQSAMESVKGKAEFILALSRENEFPRRQPVQWNGASTSFGRPFNDAVNRRGMF